MNQRSIIIVIVILLVAAFAVNASGVNLQGFLQKKPTDTAEIAPTDERRPTLRRQGTPSDGGSIYPGQRQPKRIASSEPGEYVEYESELPGVGQRTKGGPGSAYMDQYYNAHPEALVDANGNAAQIGSGRPAEVPGLPSLAEIERRRQQ